MSNGSYSVCCKVYCDERQEVLGIEWCLGETESLHYEITYHGGSQLGEHDPCSHLCTSVDPGTHPIPCV